MVAQGYNQNYLFDDELDKLSMDMVYGTASDDTEGYLKLWQDFVIRWNELLPGNPAVLQRVRLHVPGLAGEL